jgi:putative ATP-dependent endonuclease of OLD family
MYLSNLKLWNFRKFGSKDFDIESPDLDLDFNKNLNVLIGENDSGKTAIIDAVKIVLKTHSYEWIRVTEDDFYDDSDRFRIELKFKDLKPEEAKYFTEWLSWEGEKDEAEPLLKVNYDVSKNEERILPTDIRAGSDKEGYPLNSEARHYLKTTYLKTTYLKPLRDAQSELIPKRYSRLSQILKGHDIFKDEEKNELYKKFKDFNEDISSYFDKPENKKSENKGYQVKEVIDDFIHGFYDKNSESEFRTSEANLRSILETLELTISDVENPGLGTLNRLFMAVELLHLKRDSWPGLKLGLIEELEAHLHPQVQMKVIEKLQDNDDIQLILTTHSPNLASKIKLNNLIICTNDNVFPMGSDYTELDEKDYIFLEKFLDVTKSNLFFAKGVILVEGWSEEILIPTLAKEIGYDLTENEVSVINVGNVGFDHYYKIFLRKDNPDAMNVRVSVVNDVDVTAYKKNNNEKKAEEIYQKECEEEITKKRNKIKYFGKSSLEKTQTIVKPFISSEWTLEWCLYKSDYMNEIFKKATEKVHPQIFNTENYEEELANRLLNSNLSFNKTKIAYQIEELIRNESVLKGINLNEKESYQDDPISYLIGAIKYACGD